MILHVGNCRLELAIGDITRQQVDAIANAANAELAGEGEWTERFIAPLAPA